HRGGGINVMATHKDVVVVSSMREDDIVYISNANSEFKDKSFSISKTLGEKKYEKWIDYLEDSRVAYELANNGGCWSNYVKSAIIKAQFESEM
ncbi:MAG: hypothetical protein J6V66_06770, partial [Clostridia bacterium]|nr:hypothetical protein [Clostridia bacterium]